MDFDASLGIYLSAKLLGKKGIILYDVLDTYADRYVGASYISGVLRYLESKVFSFSDYGIHVDSFRVNTLYSENVNTYIIHNKPRFDDLVPIENKAKNDCFTILISGGVYEHRGVLKIITAVNDLIQQGYNLKVDVIGFGDESVVENLNRHRFVTFHGYVSSLEAQKFSLNSDLIGCLYDPESPINRMASPNKVFDAVANATLALVNQEVNSGTKSSEALNVVECEYNSSDSIKAAIMNAMHKMGDCHFRSSLIQRANDFRNGELWDSEFACLTDKLQSNS
ncbi:hypothetical protein [Alteromonas sp. S167]|uniref:hypothetical protein n=1 Tax=Alteromonas sp. S167 TaxID=3117402 RepID=UPI002FE07024